MNQQDKGREGVQQQLAKNQCRQDHDSSYADYNSDSEVKSSNININQHILQDIKSMRKFKQMQNHKRKQLKTKEFLRHQPFYYQNTYQDGFPQTPEIAKSKQHLVVYRGRASGFNSKKHSRLACWLGHDLYYKISHGNSKHYSQLKYPSKGVEKIKSRQLQGEIQGGWSEYNYLIWKNKNY